MFAYDTLVDQFLSAEGTAALIATAGRSRTAPASRARSCRLRVESAASACSASPSRRRSRDTRKPSRPLGAVRHRLRRGRSRQLRGAVPDRPADGLEPGHGVPFAARAKLAAPELAVIAKGRINPPEIGERALADGACDLVGMTRALLADPLLPRRAGNGEADRIRPCIGYNLCIARRLRKFPIGCVQNPAAGHERALGDSPARASHATCS